VIKQKILNLLENSDLPVSVPDILVKVKANKTTVYRELDQFLSDGLVKEVEFGDGKKRYEIEKSHHHHLVCKNCGKIEDIEINEKSLLTKIKTKSNFKIENHSIEFFGLCNLCQ
jgi:Fur family transcriptional regulator, ferric uptake regulator